MTVGALSPSWVDAAASHGVTPATVNISVRDADVWHTFRDAKTAKLPLDWYQDLPRHLRAPGAVVLDMTRTDEPAFLLIYAAGAAAASKKLVMRVNYRIKKGGVVNIIETGKLVDTSGIRAMIGHGYELVEGSL